IHPWRTSSRNASPLRFMKVCGFTTATVLRPARPSPRRRIPSRFHPVKRPSFFVRRSTALKPALCRVSSYSEPGLPRPRTTLASLTFLASLLALLAALLAALFLFRLFLLLRPDHFG